MTDRFLSMIGLAMKAGCAASGELACENKVRSGEKGVLVLAEDASDNTAKKFRDKCAFYCVPLIAAGTKEKLGRIIGKAERSVVFISGRMSEAVIKKAKEQNITVSNI